MTPLPDDPLPGLALRGRIGLIAGPLVMALVFLALSDLDGPARRTGAVAALMAVWWITEPIPLAATALLPIALLPLLGIGPAEQAAAPYAHPIVFLFLGGFLLAIALERWGLHRRVALGIIAAVGTRPRRLVAGFMAASAFLSLWISNTATTLLLLPIGLSVLGVAAEGDEAGELGPALLLGIAFAASIGGMGTLIGTPPNALTAAFLAETYGVRIGFAHWMLLGMPIVLVALPIAYLVLTRVAFSIGRADLPSGAAIVERERAALGPLTRGERLVALVFALAAGGWILGPLLGRWVPGLSDTGVAILAALLLFGLPVDLGRGVFVLDRAAFARVPWGVLLLFGGGLSLAAAIERSGLADAMAGTFEGLAAWPVLALLVALTLAVVASSELASNTATAAAFLPVVGALAVTVGLDPLLLVLPAGLAASGGFMLPVATPPNAIVYGSDRITIPQLVRAGALVDLAFLALVPLAGRFLVPLLFRQP
ncbi:MAG TPA: DASS family sodium-coupled anion symporter [Gemmatimonadota bacterium]|nr:DASS family sodium-coupled anion symporter [Gemmatimonadota bacterium]